MIYFLIFVIIYTSSRYRLFNKKAQIMTDTTISLQEYLNNIAAKQIAEGSRYVIDTDVAALAEQNIFTVDDFEHDEAHYTHYDFYKSVHNIKPRWIDYSSLTTQEINQMIDDLQVEYAEEQKYEKRCQEEYSRMVQARKARNAYKPNLAFDGLKNLLKNVA